MIHTSSTPILLHLLLAMSTFPILSAAEVDHTQVLLELYTGLNGDSWAERCAWNMSGPDYCSWNPDIIICDRNEAGEIFELQLAGCGVNGTVPASLTRLKKLQRLRLNSKHVVNGVPVVDDSRRVDLSQLDSFDGSDLRILSLDRTDFGPTIPRCFQGMTKLNTLVLSRSKLKGENVLDDLMHMKKLRLFHIYNNEISGTIPTQIGSLRVLSVLNAFSNRLHGQVPTEIGSATALELIDISKNDLEGSLPSQIGQLSDLAQLQMGHNPRLGGKLPETLGRLSNLLFLRLENASFTGMVPAAFRQMSSLQELKLGNNQLTRIPVKEWSLLIESLTWTVPGPHKCANQTYDLRRHRSAAFRNIYLEQHPSPYLQNLAMLDLSRNNISMEVDDVIRSVSGLMSLVSIDISHNQLHGDRQLELLIPDAFVFGSPRLMIADLDLPCKDQRVDFARHNQRKVLQIVTDLNLAGNPLIRAKNMSQRITFGQMNLKNLNISGNLGFTGELWRNAHNLQTFDATGTGFSKMPTNAIVNRGEEISRAEEVTCFAYEWTAGFARDRVVLVDSSIDGYSNCFCNDNYQSNPETNTCETCPQGQVTPAAAFDPVQAEEKNHSCVKCVPGTYRGFTNSGVAICLPCPRGEFQPLPGQSSCKKCPAGSMPDTKQTSCHAKSGYWKWPMGEQGQQGPTSPVAETDMFLKCFAIVDENGATPCTGANASNIDPDRSVTNFTSAGCLAGTDGTLCLSCSPHFTKLQSFNPFSPCVACDAAQITISALVITAVIVITVGIVVVAICTQEHRQRQRLRDSPRKPLPHHRSSALPLRSESSQECVTENENDVENANVSRSTMANAARLEVEEKSKTIVQQTEEVFANQESVKSSAEFGAGPLELQPAKVEKVVLCEPPAEAFRVDRISTQEESELRRRRSLLSRNGTEGTVSETQDMIRARDGVARPMSDDPRSRSELELELESGSGLRSAFKVMLSYFQITSSIALLPLPWSVDELWLFGISDSMGISSLSIDCLFDSSDPYVRLHVGRATFTLVLVPLAVVVTACVVSIIEKQTRGIWWSKRCTERQTIATIALAVTSHYLCTRTGLELLSCLEQDALKQPFPEGKAFLRLDPQFACPTKAEGGLEVGLAMALLVIYGCGIPLVSFIGIRMDTARGWDIDLEKDVGRREEQRYIVRRFQYLYEDYKPQYRNWELVLLFRKSLFLAIAMLLRTPEGEIEIACAQLVLFVSALVQAVYMPFRLDYVNHLDIAALGVSMATIFIGIMLRRDEISAEEVTFITIATGAGNLLFVFVVMSKIFYEVSSRKGRFPHITQRRTRFGCFTSVQRQKQPEPDRNMHTSAIPSRQRVVKINQPNKRAEVAQA